MTKPQSQKSTNQQFRPTQFCCKSTNQNFKPITNHAWNHTVPGAQVQKPIPQRNSVHDTPTSTSHRESKRGQRFQHHAEINVKNNETNDRNASGDNDEYLSHLKFLKRQHQQNIQKTTMSPSHMQPRAPHLSRPRKTKARPLEELNIRHLIGQQRRLQAAKLIKHDAIVETQAQFFTALRNLYTWPLDQLTLAPISEVRTFWDANLLQAKQCAIRAEKIDPNHFGQLRYDIMYEVVLLESYRVEDFMETFTHYRNLIGTVKPEEETYCDDTMLSFFDEVQMNIIMDLTPTWIEDNKRPPLTWYSFLSHEPSRNSNTTLPESRILAPEYYD
jgi:hypothetical protein